jgi:predicted acyl esterase
MENMFAAVKYADEKLHSKIKQEAEKKFGAKNSYVKNLWIHREYKKRGGKSSYKGKKPSGKKIQKQINASVEFDINEATEDILDII